MKQFIFSYPIPKIREEVEKRTSYLGRMRNTDAESHLLDRLSLTYGEGFLFDEYLHEAIGETYNWIKAFGRNVQNATEILEANIVKNVYEYYGVNVSVSGELKSLDFEVPIINWQWKKNPQVVALHTDSNKQEALERIKTNDILLEPEDYNQAADIYVYAWSNNNLTFYSLSETPKSDAPLFSIGEVQFALTISNGSSRLRYLENHHNGDWFVGDASYLDHVSKTGTLLVNTHPISINIGLASSVTYQYTLRYKTGIAGTPIIDEICISNIHIIQTKQEDSGCQFIIKLDATPFGVPDFIDIVDISLSIINIHPTHIQELSINDYVIYHKYNGDTEYWLVEDNCTENDFFKYARHLEGDFRNFIVYRLEIPEWADTNMIPRVRNSLYEALVNYIMWRWLEMVLPSESDVYLGKWESHVRNAQLGLNSEKTTLNRKYKML